MGLESFRKEADGASILWHQQGELWQSTEEGSFWSEKAEFGAVDLASVHGAGQQGILQGMESDYYKLWKPMRQEGKRPWGEIQLSIPKIKNFGKTLQVSILIWNPKVFWVAYSFFFNPRMFNYAQWDILDMGSKFTYEIHYVSHTSHVIAWRLFLYF